MEHSLKLEKTVALGTTNNLNPIKKSSIAVANQSKYFSNESQNSSIHRQHQKLIELSQQFIPINFYQFKLLI